MKSFKDEIASLNIEIQRLQTVLKALRLLFNRVQEWQKDQICFREVVDREGISSPSALRLNILVHDSKKRILSALNKATKAIQEFDKQNPIPQDNI